ncbi:hypothetical protein SprV_0200807300 [Sparganum proliferum]
MGKRDHTASTKHHKYESKSHHECEIGRMEFKVTEECYCKKARHHPHGKHCDSKRREACVVCCNSGDRAAHVCTSDNSHPQQKRIQSCGRFFDEPRKCVTDFDAFNAGTATNGCKHKVRIVALLVYEIVGPASSLQTSVYSVLTVSPQYTSGSNVAYGGSLIQNDYAARSAQTMGVEGRRFPDFSQDQLCGPYRMDHGFGTRFW